MKTQTRFRRGLTLIELVVAIAVSAIVILAAGVVVGLGQTSWNQTWKKVNLQRDASLAMLWMGQYIKAAASAQKSTDGRILYIPSQASPTTTFTYLADTNDLQCQTGGQTRTIIDGTVNYLQFDVVGTNQVKIDLILKEDGAETHFKTTVMMRN
jgi:prepilin-type N-terminal cleavage/methylation domain-containing protein